MKRSYPLPPQPYGTPRPSSHNHRHSHPRAPSSRAATCHPPPQRPNFIVDLHSDRRDLPDSAIESLIKQCRTKPDSFRVSATCLIAASLHFSQWCHALDAVAWLWESRLAGLHAFLPKLHAKVSVPSDKTELDDRLRSLFSGHIENLMESSDEVKNCEAKLAELIRERDRVRKLKTRPQRNWEELMELEKRCQVEVGLVERRITEFRFAMRCLLAHVEGKEIEGEGVQVFRFDETRDWSQIQSFMSRECRRLEEGLPIYAHRKEILEQINNQQVDIYLIGGIIL